MKTVAILLLFVACHSCFGAEPVDGLVAGDWSKPVNGLRGRLLLGENAPAFGTRRAIVYEELQNLSIGSAVEVSINGFGDSFRLHCTLSTRSGPIPRDRELTGSVPTPPPYRLHLPGDSMIRFPVTYGGTGIRENAGLQIEVAGMQVWTLPPTMAEDCFLSGTFTVPTRPEQKRDLDWQGTLELPPVKIPLKKL